MDVLETFDFSKIFRDWIMEIFSTYRLFVLHNGSAMGYFGCKWGVRQGGPLSPLLFVIGEDFLSRLVTKYVEENKLQPMKYTGALPFISHLLYADDVFLFMVTTKRNVRAILNFFDTYAELSSQQVN